LTTLEAIDRLNSWVRSDSARGWWSSPRYSIYDWKNAVIEQAIRAGTAECSAIHLSLTCRDCGGTKRYTDSSGYTYDHCRKCSSTGVTRLWFVVTKIEGRQFHTPRDKSWRFHLPESFWESARLSTDWEPNQKGRDLETWEVAQCLNVCEEAVLRGELPKPGSHGIYDYGDYYGEQDHGKYKLHLRDTAEVCQLCGHVGVPKDPEYPDWLDGCHHCVSLEYVDWSAWACDACQSLYGGNQSIRIFDVLKLHPPVEKLQHPEIRKWLERRGQEKTIAA
jgi:hypothetical protein